MQANGIETPKAPELRVKVEDIRVGERHRQDLGDIRGDGPPPAVVARRLLKHLLRTWGIRCVGYTEDRRLIEQQQEIERLKKIISELAHRVPPDGGADY
ncbi:MAG TPA: hypothetical protein VMG10_14395 [Gemmataceae bacterium]|nr:hypothetical protein [Gemmataceae bacterium]